jgi:crotonobetainyl-CoA:carnitine CoA-transferase CaiB-like acyl-CoA transferase
MRERTSATWLALLEEADIPVMPLHTIESLVEDPHLSDVGFVSLSEHPSEGTIRTTGAPSTWSEGLPGLRHPAPRLGEHTDAILREAGLTEEEITAATGSDAAAPPAA